MNLSPEDEAWLWAFLDECNYAGVRSQMQGDAVRDWLLAEARFWASEFAPISSLRHLPWMVGSAAAG